MPINVLTPDVAAKIAAGEVVERPSSVVKELVENSLDAGASQITIEVKGGGIELIRVTDNGCGIPADEVRLAFDRHATSKISSDSDLDTVSTLGFRGEALPSIASVARVSLVTCTHDSLSGQEIHLRWGEVVTMSPKGCPPGTSITVQGLFENVPARLKFLKSPSGERTRISDLVSRYALAFPEIRFRLLLDGRNTFTSPGNASMSDALVSVYGAETARDMLEVSWEGQGDGYSVTGYISPPSLHRANRTYITLLVNRRWISSPMLSYALSESYHGFLPEKRHPLAVLNLSIPQGDVDANVHPAKREVRFRQEDKVFSALQRAVRASLVAESPVPEMRFNAGPTFETRTAGGPTGFGPRVSSGPAFGLTGRSDWERLATSVIPPFSAPSQPSSIEGKGIFQGSPGVGFGPTPPTPLEAMSSLRILGQVRNTYLVAEGNDGMYLIDQHAAHERVLFEKVSREVADRTPQSQALLEAVAVELTPGQEEMVHAGMELLERYGFILEPFGERSYLLRAVPVVARDSNPGKALVEVLDMMAYEGILKERGDALAASIACHSAVRAGMVLSQHEMDELIRQLESCDSPHTCPHGRPTMIHLSSHHLEQEFGRR